MKHLKNLAKIFKVKLPNSYLSMTRDIDVHYSSEFILAKHSLYMRIDEDEDTKATVVAKAFDSEEELCKYLEWFLMTQAHCYLPEEANNAV